MTGIVCGANGRQYQLKKEISSGGEGIVYEINQPDLVAKIYTASKPDVSARMPELERKLKYMVSHRVPTRDASGTVIVTWPQDVLYQDGRFVGYVMPRINGAKPLYILNRDPAQASTVLANYNWKNVVIVAANLAGLVAYLHNNNVVIGDMNSNNILVYPNGRVALIDTDSFDITDKTEKIHYKCSVGTEEFLPPELQGRSLSRKEVNFTRHSDEFALAVHIFQLLMNNQHPFSAKVITSNKQSFSEGIQNHNISVGNCPYFKKIPDMDTPVAAPVMEEMLPDYLIHDFKETLDYELDPMDPAYLRHLEYYKSKRTHAEVWQQDLFRLIKENDLIQCTRDAQHYYLASMGHCELCAAKQRVADFYASVRRKTNEKTSEKPVGPQGAAETAKKQGTKKTKKSSKRAWLIAAAILLCLFLAKPAYNEISYKQAINDMNSGYYSKAVERFEELGDYKSSWTLAGRAMMQYVNQHKNNNNDLTYNYIKKLDRHGYDMSELYHELYDWRVTKSMVNTDEDDHETVRTSVTREEKWYAHFLIEGGTPEERITVYAKVMHPGNTKPDAGYSESYTVKDESWIVNGYWAFETPSNGRTGMWYLKLYNAENDDLLGTASVRIIE